MKGILIENSIALPNCASSNIPSFTYYKISFIYGIAFKFLR